MKSFHANDGLCPQCLYLLPYQCKCTTEHKRTLQERELFHDALRVIDELFEEHLEDPELFMTETAIVLRQVLKED